MAAAHLARAIKQAIAEGQQLRRVKVKCTQVAPFLVSINGSATSVPALKMAGSTFALNDTGYAYIEAGSLPHCYKVS